ncbi:MAG: hypothetical protein CL910_15330 [Deltaproteobacteria bacterium]|jgi:diguanylate cyclase (GGDEF)-like protein|nr:hypothetical protein [Deltaproteobacteria bacterium]
MIVTIEDIMSTEIDSVEADLSSCAALEKMRDGDRSCLPVVEGRVPIGVISVREVIRAFAAVLAGEALPRTAGEIMSSPPVTVGPGDSQDRAVEIVKESRAHQLLVVNGEGELIGIVTQTDLVRAQTLVVAHERDRLEASVVRRTEQLQRVNERLEHMALVDPLLGVGNRRAMDQELFRLQELASRYGRSLAVVMFDIDDFKKFNDHYGHPAADLVLGDIAAAAQGEIRGADALYRYGGEEFIVSMPETSKEGAAMAAERIREAIEALEIPHALSAHEVVTVSLGVAIAEVEGGDVDWTRVVNAADTALYEAKDAGRNRCCVSES